MISAIRQSAIREDEWQTMLKIACDVAELPDDPAVRRRRLAAGLCDLVGAHSFEFCSGEPDPESDTPVEIGSEPTEMVSKVRLADGTPLGVGIRRHRNSKPFTQRECDLVNMFHLHTWRLYGHTSPRAGSQSAIDQLPQRFRPVVHELLNSGDSEKQIAIRLKLSRHTVHEYVKSIYQRLEVGSRAELMTKFGSGSHASPAPRPMQMSLAG